MDRNIGYETVGLAMPNVKSHAQLQGNTIFLSILCFIKTFGMAKPTKDTL